MAEALEAAASESEALVPGAWERVAVAPGVAGWAEAARAAVALAAVGWEAAAAAEALDLAAPLEWHTSDMH